MNKILLIEQFSETPISFNYHPVNQSQLQEIKNGFNLREIIKSKNIRTINSYYQQGLAGTHCKMITREIVYQYLLKIAEILSPNFGLLLFDTFRTIETQSAIYAWIKKDITQKNPQWSAERITEEVRKFVADPRDPKHFTIPTHNTGGAIDLAIYDCHTGKMCDFGTEFDEMITQSNTDFFEAEFDPQFDIDPKRWQEIRKNRRILFNLMKYYGFVNYTNEWWHYDLGDCIWAKTLNIDWMFSSMENEFYEQFINNQVTS